MDAKIYNSIAIIGGASQNLLTPATKEVVADAACGSVWVNRTLRHVSRTERDGSTPGGTGMVVRSKPDPSPVMIGIPTISPACVLSGRFQVRKKRQSTTPEKVINAQKLDTSVDIKLPGDQDYVSVFSKVIGREISHSSSDDLYLRCRMKFSSNFFQIEAPQFLDLWIPAINASNELGVLGNTTPRI